MCIYIFTVKEIVCNYNAEQIKRKNGFSNFKMWSNKTILQSNFYCLQQILSILNYSNSYQGLLEAQMS